MSEDNAPYHAAKSPAGIVFEAFAPGIPKGQPRPRAFARGGKVAVYDPGTAEGWKSAVAIACQELAQRQLTGALSVILEFYLPRPKGHLRKDGSLKPLAPLWHISKPDLDNLAKAVLDALTAIGAWQDDRQVAQLALTRYWANAGEPSGCLIHITQLDPIP